MNPTKLALLNPNKVLWGLMKEITSADVHEGQTNNLHDDGLYSVPGFGRVGSEQRDQTEAFIDTKITIFNPTYFKALVQLKALYLGIIKGTEYALWDDNEKDFIKSNLLEGETGFGFFMEGFYKLEPKLNDSFQRKQRIEMVTRFQDIALTSKVLVLPAGLRDVQIQPDGRVVEQEINEYYRKLMFRSRAVVLQPGQENSSLYDNVRWSIQSSYNDIDKYLFDLMGGKTGFLRRRVGTRGVVSGTRNVITARKVSCEDADAVSNVTVNSVDIGVYQALLAGQYICRYYLLTGHLQTVFTSGSVTAKLVDRKTLDYEYVEVDENVVDKWTSPDGLTQLFNGFGNVHLRNKPIMIKGRYLGLIYDDGKRVRIIGSVNEIPSGFDRKHVRPLTYLELYYVSCCLGLEARMGQVTRYPITGVGSIIPAYINLRTTANENPRILLDDFWEDGGRLANFPNAEAHPTYFDAMSVDPSREGLFGSDHDGDQLNLNLINADDSIAEAQALMNSREYYISSSGDFRYDPIVEPHEFLFRNLSNGLTL